MTETTPGTGTTHVLRHWPSVVGAGLLAAGAVCLVVQRLLGIGATAVPPRWSVLLVCGAVLVVVVVTVVTLSIRLVIDDAGLRIGGPLGTRFIAWSQIDYVDVTDGPRGLYRLRVCCGVHQYQALWCWATLGRMSSTPPVLVTALGLIEARRERAAH